MSGNPGNNDQVPVHCNDTGGTNDEHLRSDDFTVIEHSSKSEAAEVPESFAASLLPRCTENVEALPRLSFLERILAAFTVYRELNEATHDSHYQEEFTRLQLEWTYVGGLVRRINILVMLACCHAMILYSLLR